MSYTRSNGKITFSYDDTQLVKDFLESGHDLVPIATGQDGAPLLEERSRLFPFIDDPDEVTSDMMDRIWATAYAETVEELDMLLPRNWSDESYALSSTANAVMTMSIHDDNLYATVDIIALDAFLRERLILGALREWFKGVEAGNLVEKVDTNIANLRKEMAPKIRRMILVLHRKVLRNPFSISVDVEESES